MPVAGETYDGWLNDVNGHHVKAEHVYAAFEDAHGGPIEEGSVGGGTGMSTYQFKGGSGTASANSRLPVSHTALAHSCSPISASVT